MYQYSWYIYHRILLTLGSTETWATTKPMACWERSDISGLKFLRLTEQGEERLNFFWQNFVNILIDWTRIGLHGWSYGAFLTLAAMTSQKVDFLQIGCAWRHEKYQNTYRTSWAIKYVLGPGAKNQSFCVFLRNSLFGVVLLEPLSLIGAFTTPSTLRDSWQSNNQKVVLASPLLCVQAWG